LSKTKYHKLHGFDSGAITLITEKIIDVKNDGFTTEYIRHELLHAFVAESNTESAMLNSEQIEELCASIVGEYGIEIVRLADFISNKFSQN
jgi:hypothetical protein